MNRTAVRIVAVCLCLALFSSMATAPVAAETGEERFLVELDEAGNADVSVTFVYDLDSDEAEAAFEELRGNETAQTQVTERFENRMEAVVDDASAPVDREMSVGNPAIELHQEGEVGVVTLSIEWSNLAAAGDDRVTVTEPFASGFEPDRPFTVTAPDGYDVVSTTPEPASEDGTSATWNADSDLEGFEFVAEAGSDDDDDGSAGTMPDDETTEDAAGFGVIVSVLGLLIAALLTARGRK